MRNIIYVGDGAVIRGEKDMRFGKNVNIWYNAVVRATNNTLSIGDNTNIQDNCTLHADINPIIIGSDVTIGHNAVVHGCTIGDNTVIGMGAIVLNYAKIGRNCIIGAGAVVTERAEIPDNSLVVGCPGKVKKILSDKEKNDNALNAHHYVELAHKELIAREI